MSQKDKDIDKNAETAEAAEDTSAAAKADEAKADEDTSEAAKADEDTSEAAKADEADDEKAADTSDADQGNAGGQGTSGSAPGENEELYGLLAEFDSPGALVDAAARVRDAGFTEWDCYSPFPVHGLDPAMGIKRTILPWIVFAIGLCGLGGGLLLQWWTNAYNWPWIVSGKPFFSIPANIPVTFETTILSSVFATFFGMWALNKLPQVWHPFFRKDRFRKATDDSFFIGIQASDPRFQRGKTEALLRDAGSTVVETCYTSADPARRNLPRPVTAFIIITTALALVPFALVAKARTSKSTAPRIHVFPEMDFQASYRAQSASSLFDDHRVSRLPVEGTVARGQLKSDDHLYRGLRGGEWATTFPPTFEVSKRMMERGQQRYNVFCGPCHGESGLGDGMIHERTRKLGPTFKSGWVQPTSLQQDYVIRMPHGQIFNAISNGIRTMPGYASQIPETDRWAIVLYIRALQRSQNANLNDVPPEARAEIR